jgi:primosomal protein N' (replication factor Y)
MLLNRPDFRAYERSYQLMSQVAGRAGRQGKQGKVIVQTGDPDHWVLQLVGKHDYVQFYENEIIERKNYHYPPFYKLIAITLKHENLNTLDAAAENLAELFKTVFKERVIGPEYPIVQKIRNKFLKTIKIKIEKEAPDLKVKQKIKELIDTFYSNTDNKKVRVVIDVDPL